MDDHYRLNYWSRRTNRRQLLGSAGVAGAGVAALGLVGCGGGSSSNNNASSLATPTPAGGASPTVVDPFANAKKGGTYNTYATSDPPTIDPYGNVSFQTKVMTAYVYSRLMMYGTGGGVKGTDTRPTGDAAEKWENTPDGMKYTYTLRKGLAFHNVAPVNGRAVTTDDVKFSYGRATDPKLTTSTQLRNAIDKVEYPDASTIVFTMKTPNPGFNDTLADTVNGIWIMPTESADKFDPAKTMIGSGPWLFGSYTPSVGFKFNKNPNWWKSGFPLMDSVNLAIIPDYPTQLAQFLGGNSDTMAPNAADLISIKNQVKDVALSSSIANQGNWIYFDGTDPTAPWAKDDRVRQAVSMAQDRDAITDLVYNTKKLQAGGIDVQGPWNNLIPAGMSRFWLDPQSKDQGDTAQFFKYDPANAIKLLAAAGYPSGFSTTYQYPGAIYGKGFNDAAEGTIAYINAIGIKTTTDVQDYNSKYITQTFIGNFKGITFGLESQFTDPGGYPQRLFLDNPNNHSKITKDQQLIDLTNKQATQMVEADRKATLWQIQQVNAQHMYYIPDQVGAGSTWSAWQPWTMNGLTFRTTGYGGGTEVAPFLWKNK
jgi:peptide/nickel transport system substrate-binding protein